MSKSTDKIRAEIEESRRKYEETKKVAADFCLGYFARFEQNQFNSASLIKDLENLDEDIYKEAIEFIIRAKKPFWISLSVAELKTFLEYLFTSKWFERERDSYYYQHYKRDLLESATLNQYGIEVLSDLYKHNKTIQSKAGGYIVNRLVHSQDGRAILLDFLKIDDAEIQYPALNALANHCVHPGFEPVYLAEDAHLYIDTIRSFLSHSNNDLSKVAIFTLHYGELLNTAETIALLQAKNTNRKLVGLQSLKYLKIDSSKAQQLCTLVVECLESDKLDISNAALKGLSYLSDKFSNLVAGEILDGLVVRKHNYPKEFFNTNTVISALREVFKKNQRLPGEVLHKLCRIAYTSNIDVRNRSVFVATALNKKEFLALVNEQRENNPSFAKSILNTVTGALDTDQIVNQISQTDPKDVQQNAANQITVPAKYYENGLSQAKTSFNWAIAITIFSIISFIVAVLLFMNNADKTGTVIAGLGGALTQLIAGTLLFIYRRTLIQLDNYTEQMSKVQNYLLANSFVESLDGEAKEQARMELIKTVANSTNP